MTGEDPLVGQEIVQNTLPNGLRVVVAPQPSLHRVSLALFVATGSRFETRENNGISHFLEHMLYRGTQSLPTAHAQSLAFERLGGTLSAATHADHTLISIGVPPASLAPVIALLGEVLRTPRFSDLELERRIIREEILEDKDESGREIDPDNLVRTVAFGDHPLGFPITGPVSALDGFDEAKLRAHMTDFYGASNAVFAAAGACSATSVLDVVERHLGPLACGTGRRPLPFTADQKSPRRKHVSSPGSQSDLRISFVTPGERHPSAAAIDLLLRILDDGMSTRLYHALCDAAGLVYDCFATWEPWEECGALDIGAEVQHERLPEVVRTILALTTKLSEAGPEPEEIDKARRRHRWALEAALDDADAMCALAGGALFFERERSVSAWARRFDEIGIEEVAAAARAIFRPEGMQVVTVGSLHGRERDEVRAAIREFAGRART